MFTVYILLEESHYSIRLFSRKESHHIPKRYRPRLQPSSPNSFTISILAWGISAAHASANASCQNVGAAHASECFWCECLQPCAGEPCFSECVFNAKGRRSTKILNQTCPKCRKNSSYDPAEEVGVGAPCPKIPNVRSFLPFKTMAGMFPGNRT